MLQAAIEIKAEQIHPKHAHCVQGENQTIQLQVQVWARDWRGEKCRLAFHWCGSNQLRGERMVFYLNRMQELHLCKNTQNLAQHLASHTGQCSDMFNSTTGESVIILPFFSSLHLSKGFQISLKMVIILTYAYNLFANSCLNFVDNVPWHISQ